MDDIDLSTLDLGPLDADDDENLHEYFVPFGSFREILQKKRFIVVGAKGTGKSAIRMYLSQSREEDNQMVVPIDDTYSLLLSQLGTSSPAEIKNKMKGYLTGIVLQTLLSDSRISKTSKQQLKKFEDDIPLVKKLLKPLKLKAQFVEYAMGELFAEGKRSNLLRVIDPSIGKAVRAALGANDLWILIDDIDAVFTGDDEDSSLRFIEGLIYAASDLNVRTFDKSVHIVLLLRSEIYDKLLTQARDLDKELQYVWQISWDSDELQKFLAKRIKWALKAKAYQQSWRHWKLIFHASKKDEIVGIQNYLIERIINGPRDLLLLVGMARNVAVSEGASVIGLPHIEESEFDYGKTKLSQITRNFQRSYPNIDLVLDHLFRNANSQYSRSELEKYIRNRLLTDPDARDDFAELRWLHTLTAFRFIEILYQVGIIGYWDPRLGRFVYVLENANPPRALIGSAEFKVHSAFSKYLELK